MNKSLHVFASILFLLILVSAYEYLHLDEALKDEIVEREEFGSEEHHPKEPTQNAHHGGDEAPIPLALDTYEAREAHFAKRHGGAEPGLWTQLELRVLADPFNLVATIIFVLAVAHTFAAGSINKIAHRWEHQHQERLRRSGQSYAPGTEPVSFKATILHFLGEVEAIFGIWLIPLLLSFTLMHSWADAKAYMITRDYTEAMFVVVIMAIAGTKPVLMFAEICLKQAASLGGGKVAAWWLSILTISPLLGSFITEPAAMTIGALLLGQQFYRYRPNSKFAYATLGLLFVNVSVGGTLTHFAAPPVLMVAGTWDWDITFMFTHFGWRAALGIVVANVIFFLVFRKQFAALGERKRALAKAEAKLAKPREPVPIWIVLVHLIFLAWTVFTLHEPPLFIGGFLFFIGFTIATEHHQYDLHIKGPLLVGFFLAALVTHGGLQNWWIAPVLSDLAQVPLFIGATILTAFNDNAAITFLASQVPAFDSDVARQYAVVAGAVTGGGLTVIANAPNPAGQSILKQFFSGNISPVGLFLGALIPTLVMAFMFMVVP